MSHARRNHSRGEHYSSRQRRLRESSPFPTDLELPTWVAGTELSKPIDLRRNGDGPSVEPNLALRGGLREGFHPGEPVRTPPLKAEGQELQLPLTGGAKERPPTA